MKHAIAVIIIMFIVVGCESNEVTNDKATTQHSEAVTDNYNDEILDAKRMISEIEETNQKLNYRIVEMEEKIKNDTNKHSRTEEIIKKVTQLEKFEYEILSEEIDRPPYDSVVYVADVPDSLGEQEIYVIRSAIQFAEKNFTKVSLWKDRQTAITYIDNDYDPEDGFDGWSGFDQIFGFIDNTSMPPKLTFKSGHDEQIIEFGKYTYE